MLDPSYAQSNELNQIKAIYAMQIGTRWGCLLKTLMHEKNVCWGRFFYAFFFSYSYYQLMANRDMPVN